MLSDNGEPIYKEEYFDKIYRNWGEDFWRIKEDKAQLKLFFTKNNKAKAA